MEKNLGLCCDLKVKPLQLQTDMAVIEAKRSEEKYVNQLFKCVDYTAKFL